MAERRRARNDGKSGAQRWWWLALPLLGIAAYAAFDATLRLIMPREEPAQVVPLHSAVHPPAAAAAPPASIDAPVAGGAQVAIDAAPVAAEPSPTPTAARVATEVAGSEPAKGKSKAPAPKEHLTGEDKRALEQVLERATGQKSR